MAEAFEGITRVKAALDRIGPKAQDEISVTLKRFADEMRDKAKALAPSPGTSKYSTGRLQSAIHSYLEVSGRRGRFSGGLSAVVTVDPTIARNPRDGFAYAKIVEYGRTGRAAGERFRYAGENRNRVSKRGWSPMAPRPFFWVAYRSVALGGRPKRAIRAAMRKAVRAAMGYTG